MIWRATRKDVPELVKMGRLFARAIGEEPHDASLLDYMTGLIEQGIIYRSKQGMIGGIVVTQPWNRNRRMAQELFWWSEDRKGMALMRAFEKWAEAQGVGREYVVFSTIGAPGRTDELMGKLGYKQVERAYRRL